MFNNHIKVTKNDVQIRTNGPCVDIRITQDGDGRAAVTFVTLNRDTGIRLRDALDAYLTLDRTP